MPDIEFHVFLPIDAKHAYIRHVLIRLAGFSDGNGSAERPITDMFTRMDELFHTIPHLESVTLESQYGPDNSEQQGKFSDTANFVKVREKLRHISWRDGWDVAQSDIQSELDDPERVPVSPVWCLPRYERERALKA